MRSFEGCWTATRAVADLGGGLPLRAPKGASAPILALVLGENGPAVAGAGQLDALRALVERGAAATGRGEGDVIVASCGAPDRGRIAAALRGIVPGAALVRRAASVKMLRHLYLQRLRGGQVVWVYAPPRSYERWIHEEFDGALLTALLARKASKVDEVYSADDRRALGDATAIALRWSMLATARLGRADADATVERWFGTTAAKPTLLRGFKRIAGVLNSSLLVLSDEPIDRGRGGWSDYAFVNLGERMSVVYMQGAAVAAARGPKTWLAALTLIHELSHREMATDDHRYDHAGRLSPTSPGGLTEAQALQNADNWGYFAADLAGALGAADVRRVSGVAPPPPRQPADAGM